MTGGALLGLALAVPLVMLVACLWPAKRAMVPGWLAVAPVPALLAALGAPQGELALPQALLSLRLALDGPASVLLGCAALLWIVGGFYATAWLRGRADSGRFVAWWLLTLTGSIGVFMAADLVGFYLLFSMVSLAAFGLIVDDGSTRSRRAGLVYVGLAVLGEAFLLMAFVLMAQATPDGSLLISDAVAALPAAPSRDAILALLLLGFGAKIGLPPFHVWMPLSYRAAPIPAAAVMSGAAVKAGVIGLIRFLPPDVAFPGWGGALAAVGLLGAYWGVAVGITQSNPKVVLAYSSVSQMGLLAAVFGTGLAAGDPGVALAAAFYAAHHILVKGTLFLSVGVIQAGGRRWFWPVLAATAVIALSLAGLPFTGGALAKLAVKPALGGGLVGGLAALSAAGSALLMLHFLRLLVMLRPPAPSPNPLPQAGEGFLLAWGVGVVASVTVPWALYLQLGLGTVGYALGPAILLAAAWPIVLGGVLAVGLARWGGRLPRVPPGDIIDLATGAGRLAGAASEGTERMDGMLRRWPVAGVSLLALAAALCLAMLGGCSPTYSPDTYASTAAQQANKVEQGVIVGVRPVGISASGVVGGASGAAAGGAIGSQAGATGLTAALGAVGGSLVGGLVGTTVEHAQADTTAFEYVVKESKGDLVSVTQKDDKPLAIGQKVLVIAGNQARVVPDYTVTPPAPPPPTQTAPPPAPVAETPLAPLTPPPAAAPATPAPAQPPPPNQPELAPTTP
jgi:formate hydrogenlyase subunit 3/multisubunit Na+/H+ antiporter MnhD subunit/outer membrane lipoprotein SlyB